MSEPVLRSKELSKSIFVGSKDRKDAPGNIKARFP